MGNVKLVLLHINCFRSQTNENEHEHEHEYDDDEQILLHFALNIIYVLYNNF